MLAAIALEIPNAEVRLLRSRARGEARADSDVDLLITMSDQWLAAHDRWSVLDCLHWNISEPSRPVDILLFPQSQVEQRRKLLSNVVDQACQEGLRLDG